MMRPSLFLCSLLCLASPFHASAALSSSGAAWPQLPVLQNGRVMPMDSYARQILLSISGRNAFGRESASHWIARAFFTPDSTRDDRIFLINNPEVVEALGLIAQGRARYSFAQLQPTQAELSRLARATMHLEEEARSPVDSEILRLFNNLDLYRRLTQGFDFALPKQEFAVQDAQLARDLDLPVATPLPLRSLETRSGRLNQLVNEISASPATGRTAYQQEGLRLSLSIRGATRSRPDLPPTMLPAMAASVGDSWVSPWDARGRAEFAPDVDALCEMARAFRQGQAAEFEQAAQWLQESIAGRTTDPALLRKIGQEVVFNQVDAFYRAELLYGLSFLAVLLSIALRQARWLYRGALLLAGLALVPHTYGLLARMFIMGRPPVTNLYATFIFVGWVCALLGLAAEWLQRNRLGLLTAAAGGLTLLLTAGRFGEEGDTMGVMVAVLDSNFWLATHVVCISIGYAGCCASGLVGHVYLLQALRREPSDPVLLETYRAVYGMQAFGLIFTFLGTMLGGVWADQSWGRFWGWDPKENGALVIVLWSAILFHARLGRMIADRGFAAGAVLGVVGVLLAWMGVNLLGVGLHSYGFTSGIAQGLLIACALEMVFVAITAPLARRAAVTGPGSGRPPG